VHDTAAAGAAGMRDSAAMKADSAVKHDSM